MVNTPGIKHVEFWVSDLNSSLNFYQPLFLMLGWAQYADNGFRAGGSKIYFKEHNVTRMDSVGPRHICFRALSRDIVNQVYDYLKPLRIKIIRGPQEDEYRGKKSYHIDFADPDGYIIEVSFSV